MKKLLLITTCVLICSGYGAFASDYDRDINEPLGKIKDSSALSDDDKDKYTAQFKRYQEFRSDLFTSLIQLIGKTDKDISSDWNASVTLASLSLTHDITEELPKLEELGLKDWAEREKGMYEKIKDEKFLAARVELISIRENAIKGNSDLNDQWKNFLEQNQPVDSALDKLGNANLDALGKMLELVGTAADLLKETPIKGSDLLGVFARILDSAKARLDQAQDWCGKVADKKKLVPYLKTLNEMQDKIEQQIDDSAVDKARDNARNTLDSDGPEDYKEFRTAAMDAIEVHANAARDAFRAYSDSAVAQYRKHVDQTVSEIFKQDEIGKELATDENKQKEVDNDISTEKGQVDNLSNIDEKHDIQEKLSEIQEAEKKALEMEKDAMDSYNDEISKLGK